MGIGCLTNRSSVARRVEALLAQGAARRCTIVPCVEVWSGPFMAAHVGDLSEMSVMPVRPSYEDLLGAGSIVAAWERTCVSRWRRRWRWPCSSLIVIGWFSPLEDCVSGRELIVRSFGCDVAIAAGLDSPRGVPERRSGDLARMFTGAVSR